VPLEEWLPLELCPLEPLPPPARTSVLAVKATITATVLVRSVFITIPFIEEFSVSFRRLFALHQIHREPWKRRTATLQKNSRGEYSPAWFVPG
jgi:hypothetical protein